MINGVYFVIINPLKKDAVVANMFIFAILTVKRNLGLYIRNIVKEYCLIIAQHAE